MKNFGNIKILMLIPHLGVGGAQGAFLRLAEYLAKHANVTIALMEIGAQELGPVGVPVISLSDASSALGKAGRWWGMLQRLRALKRNHDVAISFLSGVNLLNALAGPRHKTLVSERGSKRQDIGMSDRQRMLWTRILDPLTYWLSGRVVAASKGLAYEIVCANPWTADRVGAIEGTVKAAQLVDSADLPVEPAIERLAEFETLVAFGRLHVSKGYDFLMRVFAELRAARPRARLLLIGDGPEDARLREIAEGLGLRCSGPDDDGDVIFTGVRSDPLRYARIGRVFVLPSRFEGLPNALIEALAAGVPVMASDCHWGPRSILSEGQLVYGKDDPLLPAKLKHGVLMPVPESPDAFSSWVQELGRMLEAPRTRLDRNERFRVAARYDIATTGPIWLRVAKEVASAGR